MVPSFVIPDELIEQAARGNVVPFLGLYISVGRGNEPALPSLCELADKLVRRSRHTNVNPSLVHVARRFELLQRQHAFSSSSNKQLSNTSKRLPERPTFEMLHRRVIIPNCPVGLFKHSPLWEGVLLGTYHWQCQCVL